MSKYNCIGTVGRMWGKNFQEYFLDSYVDLIQYNTRYLCKDDEYIKYTKATVSWHEMGRNQLVQESLGEWLLMLDTDHTFMPDVLERLLYFKKKHNCRVISGIYQYKFEPHAPVVNVWTDAGLAPVLEFDRKADVLQVGAVGAGCLLIDRSVFLEIKNKLKCNPFDIIQGLSEDYSFCKRCKDLDIPVYVSPRVQAHHVIDHVLSVDDFMNFDESVKVKMQDGKILC